MAASSGGDGCRCQLEVVLTNDGFVGSSLVIVGGSSGKLWWLW